MTSFSASAVHLWFGVQLPCFCLAVVLPNSQDMSAILATILWILLNKLQLDCELCAVKPPDEVIMSMAFSYQQLSISFLGKMLLECMDENILKSPIWKHQTSHLIKSHLHHVHPIIISLEHHHYCSILLILSLYFKKICIEYPLRVKHFSRC